MSEMFCAARKEQESRCLFAYSGDYLSGKNAFQNSSSSVVFGVLKQLDSSKLKKTIKLIMLQIQMPDKILLKFRTIKYWEYLQN